MASCRAAFGDTVLALWREGRSIAVVTSGYVRIDGARRLRARVPHAHVEVASPDRTS